MGDPAVQLEPASEREARAEPESRDTRGLLDQARQPVALIGDPPPSEHSWSAEGRSSYELCPLLEPGSNWTASQSSLNGRVREPMSFWDTEQRQCSDQDPR